MLGAGAPSVPGATDFSSFLLQAQASKAKIIGLANAGGDTINSIKQAARVRHRARRPEARRPAGVHHRRARARPEDRAGPDLTEALYWDLNDSNRAFAKEFASAKQGQHADHGAGRRLLGRHALPEGRAGRWTADGDGAAVVAKMKAMPTDDELFGKGTIRADGRKIHDMYLFEVKKPAESKGAVGLLQAARHHPGRRGLPAAGRGRLPAGEEVSTCNPGRLGAPALCRAARSGPPMFELLGVPPQALFGQLLLGPDQRRVLRAAVARACRHLRPAERHQLRARRAVHDGRLRAPGCCWTYFGIGYWGALMLAPIIVGVFGVLIERLFICAAVPPRSSLRPAADVRAGADHRGRCSASVTARPGLPYTHPDGLRGAPISASCSCRDYRAWVVVASLVVCLATWFMIEKTQLGAYLRAATENADAGAGLRHQCAADGHADLWLRRRRWRRSPACWRRRSIRSTR